MEELRCAAIIANLEGIKHLAMWMGEFTKSTSIANLDNRVRRLETSFCITPPPPVTEPTWKGLVWRVWRLRSRIPRDTVNELEADASTAGKDLVSMIRDSSEITLADVTSAVHSIKGVKKLDPDDKFDSDDAQLSYCLQVLCNVIGENQSLLGCIPMTIVDIYATAVRVSIQFEKNGRWGPHLPGMRPPLVPARCGTKPAKPCCGCCSCFCHNNRPGGITVPPPARRGHVPARRAPRCRERSTSSERSERFVREKPSRFGWFRKLCFWKRDAVKDDESISSSDGSRTIVD